MRVFAPIAASAVGAGVTGASAGLIALTTVRSRLPGIMARMMRPVPTLDDKRVLLCTGTVDPAERGSATDEALMWRRAIEAEHQQEVLLIDLRTGPQAGGRARERAAQLAQSVPAQHRRRFGPAEDPGRSVRLRDPQARLTHRR